MKYIACLVSASALALSACGGGGSSGGESEGGDSPAKAISGDRAVITVEGGTFDGVHEVAVANCDLETPRINVATVQDIDGKYSLLAMSDPQDDGTASFQMLKSETEFFDSSAPINYTIDGKRLTGSGGEMSGDPGKVSVEIICE